MRALSLWQPHATFIAIGSKLFETRPKRMPSTMIGIPVAIQAARKVPTRDEWLDLAGAFREEYEVADAPMRARIMTAMNSVMQSRGDGLVLGAMVCVVRFAASVPAETIVNDPFGDFSAGRWATPITELLEVLDPPVPARGYQGPFHWERQ